MPDGITGLLANNTLLQIVVWNTAGSVVNAVLSPYLQAISNQVNAVTPLVPLSPAELAQAVIRNERTEAEAAAEARMSGLSPERFHTLTRLVGQAPGPEALAEALRRTIIDEGTYLRGIRQGNLRDEWADLVKRLSVREPSPVDALEALLEGQLDEGRARALYARFGGAPEHFDWLFDTRGTAPTPTQALELANRGIIPWDGEGPGVTSFRQAFLEGPWRNKWAGPFRALGEYLPPPRTVTAMYKEGSITRERAIELLRKQGLAPDLAVAYVSSGSDQKVEKTKELAQATITTLYRDRIVPRPDALAMLGSLGYDAEEAGWILEVEDVRVAQRFLAAAVGRVRTLYVRRRITRAQASTALGELQVPASGASDLLAIWDWERAAAIPDLTAAQITAAFRVGVFVQPDAQVELEALGYTPHDAWVLLSITAKRALPDEPARAALGAVTAL